jgi:hypothetical protein
MALPSLDVDRLPLVLAGPIVRRVEPGGRNHLGGAEGAAEGHARGVGRGVGRRGPSGKVQEGTGITARIGAPRGIEPPTVSSVVLQCPFRSVLGALISPRPARRSS